MDEDTITKTLRPWVIPVAVGIVSALGGIGVGWLLRKRKEQGRIQRLESMVLELANGDAIDTTDFTVIKYERPSVVGPREEVEDFVVVETGAPPRPDPTDDDVPHQPHRSQTHPFERLELDKIEWSYEAERATRTDTAPYILHRDEFFGEEMGFDQSTWTYYEGDDILVDETDTPVYNYQENTGELKWGHGSGDENVVYIRNEDMKAEYEVVRNEGHYSVEVLGLELEERLAADDLRHSRQQRFRDSD